MIESNIFKDFDNNINVLNDQNTENFESFIKQIEGFNEILGKMKINKLDLKDLEQKYNSGTDIIKKNQDACKINMRDISSNLENLKQRFSNELVENEKLKNYFENELKNLDYLTYKFLKNSYNNQLSENIKDLHNQIQTNTHIIIDSSKYVEKTFKSLVKKVDNILSTINKESSYINELEK